MQKKYYQILLGFNVLLNIWATEYYFSKRSQLGSPSYLKKCVENVTELNFPAKLEITFAFSTFEGTLYTSIDFNKHSLSLRMEGNKDFISYNKDNESVELSKFCNCKRKNCRYEKLSFIVWVTQSVSYQCNNGSRNSFKITSNQTRMRSKATLCSNNKKQNQALVFAINHENNPYIGKSFKNQLIGCIFEIKYNDKVIQMEKKGPDVKEGCPRRCNDSNPCNGTKCIETYSEYNVLCEPESKISTKTIVPNCKTNWVPIVILIVIIIILVIILSLCSVRWKIKNKNQNKEILDERNKNTRNRNADIELVNKENKSLLSTDTI